jgi:hypothetical protein
MKPKVTKITNKWIKKEKPCQSALNWWDGKERDPITILKNLIFEKHYDWAIWFIASIMNYNDHLSLFMYVCKQLINVYEKQHPNNKKLRKNIELLTEYIKNSKVRNKKKISSYISNININFSDMILEDSLMKKIRLKVLNYGLSLK